MVLNAQRSTLNFFCAALLFCGAVATYADDAVPVAFPKNRYDPVRTHSPFAVATAEAPPVVPQASFAANWFVSGIARLGDDDFVTIKSRDLATEFSLYGHDTDPANGVSVASVNWTDVVGKSTVILRKGTETAKLEFNEAEVHAAPTAGKSGSPAPNAPRTPPNMAAPQGPPNVPPNPVIPNGGVQPPVHRRMQVIQPPQ